jgi:hypothetical protein
MHYALVYDIKSVTLRDLWYFHRTRALCLLKIKSILVPFTFHICSWTFQNVVLFCNISPVYRITLQMCLRKKYPHRLFHNQYSLSIIHWTHNYTENELFIAVITLENILVCFNIPQGLPCGLVVRVPGYRCRGHGFDFPTLPYFLKISGSGMGSTQLRQDNSGDDSRK